MWLDLVRQGPCRRRLLLLRLVRGCAQVFTMALEYNSLTLADFLGSRYNSPLLRRLAALVIFGASGLYLIAVYKGSALALQQFLGLEYHFAAVAIFVVVTTYTLAGGFRSVVLTDSAQGLLMAVGSVVLFAAVIIKGGGLTAMVDTVRAQDPNLVSWEGNLPLAAFSAFRSRAE